ncbi:MAG: zinc-ribbon domain-containing protein [Chloroflexi bacterium]|nr:zinc-ribbon domain-containing protein [Chloroflexota bacterium]
MPVCTNCGSQQPDGAAFCDECGAKLEKTIMPPVVAIPQHTPTAVNTACSVCGTSVIPGEAFCDNCGAALEYDAVPIPQAQPAGPDPSIAPTVLASAQADVQTCTDCGAQLDSGSNFCDMCGAPANTTTPAPIPEPSSVPPGIPPTQPAPVASSPTPVPPASTPQEQYPATASPPVYSPEATIRGHMVAQRTNVAIPFPPGRTEIIIGREDPVSNVFPEIDLTDHGGDEGGVSRRHARIFVQGDQIFVEDLNSTNYTHVNQQRLTPGHPHPLNDGDELRFGRVKLDFYFG